MPLFGEKGAIKIHNYFLSPSLPACLPPSLLPFLPHSLLPSLPPYSWVHKALTKDWPCCLSFTSLLSSFLLTPSARI